MDLPLTEKDIISISSDFATMITICKKHILNLEDEAQRHLDDYLEELAHITFGADSTLDEHMELWLKDLKTRLTEYEFYGRATALRTYLYPSNYLHTLRTPTKKMGVERTKIPVHNITLPVEKEDLLVSFVRPRQGRNRKCVPIRSISVCGM
ncbi:uncharacterized protein LOC108630165 [Ceratina calcarata]|uniref:Uncharacterized protein LOC108630165 n=1 Tax=Ceratina calcarata TaxID=156304 RepID=A0AAJ7NCM7_9HYME|nr:uncharacterized protein LOC108630165 [Ceratina calcarata]XP_026673671.1 uncharacterized protein LOC108630165 [Ceratina calcarata]